MTIHPRAPRYQRLVHDALLASAAATPAKTAVFTRDGDVTYAGVWEAAARLARALQDRGVRRGDRVALYLENGVPTVVGVYAASLAGGAFVVVNPQTKADKLRYLLEDCSAAAVVTDARGAAVVAEALRGASVAPLVIATAGAERGPDGTLAWDEVLASAPPEPLAVGTIPNDLAALVYTSGSTGNPKGVMLSHQNVVFTQGSLCEYLRLSPDDRILNVLPLAFDYGLYQLLMAVHQGASLVLETSFTYPAETVRRVQETGATVLPGVPTIFATLLALHRSEPYALPSVRRITNTAAHLPDEFVGPLRAIAPDALIFKMYGLTECKRVCYLEPELVQERPSSVGKAIPGTEAFVLGDDGRPVPPGVTGVLHVRGPHVMMGYWNLPEETAAMLKPGPFPGERMLCARDFFRMDADGFLYFVGRDDDIIKSRGEKVSPVEVENVLHALPGVREAAVIGVPDDVLGEAVRAYVVLDDGVTMTEQAFKRACLARLESFMVPRDVVFVSELPKTDTGKVRKKSLREAQA